ncbi:hypothetical protein C8034_v006223 [Colletotrichum sidae]|uniref:GPI anchored serine-threonine rich protein n=1 Tax=Colletotrichum sidae TaxID=1347389 RepID=A0A4R8T4W5_9PEZI|nr:hypothetical protein C8034_v006223 [Colletotrichum sidae]
MLLQTTIITLALLTLASASPNPNPDTAAPPSHMASDLPVCGAGETRCQWGCIASDTTCCTHPSVPEPWACPISWPCGPAPDFGCLEPVSFSSSTTTTTTAPPGGTTIFTTATRVSTATVEVPRTTPAEETAATPTEPSSKVPVASTLSSAEVAPTVRSSTLSATTTATATSSKAECVAKRYIVAGEHVVQHEDDVSCTSSASSAAAATPTETPEEDSAACRFAPWVTILTAAAVVAVCGMV